MHEGIEFKIVDRSAVTSSKARVNLKNEVKLTTCASVCRIAYCLQWVSVIPKTGSKV